MKKPKHTFSSVEKRAPGPDGGRRGTRVEGTWGETEGGGGAAEAASKREGGQIEGQGNVNYSSFKKLKN